MALSIWSSSDVVTHNENADPFVREAMDRDETVHGTVRKLSQSVTLQFPGPHLSFSFGSTYGFMEYGNSFRDFFWFKECGLCLLLNLSQFFANINLK